MFEEIFLAVSKLLALVVIFLVSFGLGFHILLGEKVHKLKTLGKDFKYTLKDDGTFKNGWWSVLQTFAMMIGELNFNGIIYHHLYP